MTAKKRLDAIEARMVDRSRDCFLITHIRPNGERGIPNCPHGHPLSADHHECDHCEVPASKRHALVFRHIPADWARDKKER